MKRLLIICAMAIAIPAGAQTYRDSIAVFRKQYVKELLEDARSPIKQADTRYMHFYDADPAYRTWASVELTPGSKPFLINTHSTKQKPFKEYAVLTFKIKDTTLALHVYQSVDLVSGKPASDDLFLPFTDLTNYETTYAGGRYIDLKTTDIVDGRLMLDFNKCYNPYCAFADGYSCPIPPDENALHISIMAGEKLFTKNMGY